MGIKDELRGMLETEAPRKLYLVPSPPKTEPPIASPQRAADVLVPSVHACEYCRTRPCTCERQGRLFALPVDNARTSELQRLIHPEAKGLSAEEYRTAEAERILPVRKSSRREYRAWNTKQTG